MPDQTKSDQVTSDLPHFNPNISHLKRQAKELKRAAESGGREAIARLTAAGVETPEQPSLRSAQLTIAREHGFAGWHELLEEAGERMVDMGDVHRWFGVHLNNEAWRLIDEQAITPESALHEKEEALYRAYASMYHWLNSGNAMNQGRGEHLVSRTAVLVGEPEVAIRHAQRYLDLIDSNPQLAEDWDRAFAFEAKARALAAAGETGPARTAKAEAERLCALIAEDGERVIVEAELAREPWFGL